MTGPGPSWLSSLPAGASVLDREVAELRVVAVVDGCVSVRKTGESRTRFVDLVLVPDGERALVAPRTRLWLVAERVCLAGGLVETRSAYRVRRPGIGAEAAFQPGARVGGAL